MLDTGWPGLFLKNILPTIPVDKSKKGKKDKNPLLKEKKLRLLMLSNGWE